MVIKSMVYKTDLFFIERQGAVIDKGEYMVALTPNNPSAIWGNFLIFERGPGRGDYERWTSMFKHEIGHRYSAKNMAFAWDDVLYNAGDLAPFVERGFTINKILALSLRRGCEKMVDSLNQAVSIRPITTAEEWEAVVRNQVLCRSKRYSYDGYMQFKRKQMRNYYKMVREGAGLWFGAFIKDRLVADLGLFFKKEEAWARFQKVETIPEYRNMGIATKIVDFAGRYAFNTWNTEQLIIAVEKDHPAQRIYSKLGFTEIENITNMDIIL